MICQTIPENEPRLMTFSIVMLDMPALSTTCASADRVTLDRININACSFTFLIHDGVCPPPPYNVVNTIDGKNYQGRLGRCPMARLQGSC